MIYEASTPAAAEAIRQAEALLQPGMSLDGARSALSNRIRERLANTGGPLQDRADWLRRHIPTEVERVVADADQAAAGRLILPGTGGEPRHVGDPPRWHENPVQDDQYVWCLNRMVHWTVLLRAWQLTGRSAYAERVMAEFDDWTRACPRPALDMVGLVEVRRAYDAVTPWRILEAGIRMFDSWLEMIDHLIDAPLLTRERFARLIVSAHQHGAALATISPQLWPNSDHNHLIMESLGLLALSTRYRELADATRWRQQALAQLERCAERQYVEDGGQIEGCPLYHDLSVSWYCQVIALVKEAGAQLPEATRRLLARALDYVQHSTRPTGRTVPWGDSDADHLAMDAALDWLGASGDPGPLQTLGALASRQDLTARAHAAIWRLGDPDRLLRWLDMPHARPPSRLNWQRGLSQVAMRSAWDRQALSVFFACRTPVNNGHAHIDPGSFDFTACGRAMVVDPGRFTYREDADRRLFKSTSWHNTLTVDERDAFAYESTWEFGPQQRGDITGTWQEDGLLAAACMHRSFQPACHRRAIALIDGRCLVVLDDVDGLGERNSVQAWFHLASTAATWRTETQSGEARFDDAHLSIAAAAGAGALAGSLEPGRFSETFDTASPSLRLRLADRGGPARRLFATVLAPMPAGQPPARIDGLAIRADGDDCICSFRLGGRGRSLRWDAGGLTLAG